MNVPGLIPGLIALSLLAAPPARAVPFKDGYPVTTKKQIFPLEELQVGTRGVGYTVFVGHEVRPFQVEVLGLLEGMLGPHRPIILARLTGPEIEATGVIAGMSGSPVFVGDRLLGAVSYRFGSFTKEAIAGITPIQSMLEIYEGGLDGRGPAKSPISGAAIATRSVELPRLEAPAQPSGPYQPARIETPVFLAGFSDKAASRISDELRSAGLIAVSGGAAATSAPSARKLGKPFTNESSRAGLARAAPIAPGAPVAAVLLTGDLFAAATGTVTLVDDGIVLGFGHPFFGYGHVQFPMATAAILNTLNSAAGSYKQAATAIEVGTIDDDRLTAIGGKIGKLARMVPITVSVQPAGRDRTIDTHVEVVDHDVWTALMLRGVIESAASGRLSAEAGGTIETTATFELGDRKLVLVDTYAAPPPMDVGGAVANDLAMVAYAIGQNTFEEARVGRIKVSMRSKPEVELAYLEQIVPETQVVRPGQTIKINARVRPYRAPPFTTSLELPIPRDAEGSVEVYVGGALELDRRDAKVYGDRVPRSIEDLVRIIEERRPGGGLYARVYLPQKGLRSSVDLLQALPVSKRMALDAPAGVVRREVAESLGPSVSRPISAFVIGGFAVTLRVVS